MTLPLFARVVHEAVRELSAAHESMNAGRAVVVQTRESAATARQGRLRAIREAVDSVPSPTASASVRGFDVVEVGSHLVVEPSLASQPSLRVRRPGDVGDEHGVEVAVE